MIGTLIAGRYRLEQQIGSGGMGTVFAAHDERLQRQVAIKILRPEVAADPRAKQRFLSEGQIAGQLTHPNIVRTYDAGDDPAGPFLVQELLTGVALDQRLPLSAQEALVVLDGMAAALGTLHDQGLVHCDVKPQNIWLRPDGTPVLLDFGIARNAGAAVTTLIATPHYLAPERFDGAPPTPASDWYALGMVAYQLITGRPPFDQANLDEIITAQRSQPVPPLPAAQPLATGLDAIIRHLTAKDPAQRYANAAMLRQDLAALQQGQSLGSAGHDQPTLVVAPSGRPAQLPPALAEPQAPRNQRVRRMAWLGIPLLLVGTLFAVQLGRRTGAAPQPTVQIAPAVIQPPVPATATIVAGSPTVVPGPVATPNPPVTPPAEQGNGKDKDKPKENGKDPGKGKDKK